MANMYAIQGFDLGYGGGATRSASTGSPNVLLFFPPPGTNLTVSNYSYSGTDTNMYLFMRSWTNGSVNPTLNSGFNGNTVMFPGPNGWGSGSSVQATTWGSPNNFPGGTGQVYSMLAQDSGQGAMNQTQSITVTPATPQPDPASGSPLVLQVTFNNVDNAGGNITATVTIATS